MNNGMAEDNEAAAQQAVRTLGRSPSARAAWGVVVLSLLLLLVMAASLEALHRAEVTRMLGRPPADWNSPVVREYATVEAFLGLGFPEHSRRLARVLVDKETTGEIKAAAAWEIAVFSWQMTPEETLPYHRIAVDAAPADSPRLGTYYRTYARKLEKVDRILEAEEVLRQGLARVTDQRQQGSLLRALLNLREESEGPRAALTTYEECARLHPRIAEQDTVRAKAADLLAALGRTAEAREIYSDLAEHADAEWCREEAAEKLRELEGPVKNGH